MSGTECTDRSSKRGPSGGEDDSGARSALVGLVRSRALLAALGTQVVAAARAAGMGDLPEPHLGADLANSPEPHAQQLRATEASFDWLAFAHPDVPMWEAHVGVVHVGHASYDVGVHLAARLIGAEDDILQLAGALGRTPTYSERSRELQVVVRRFHLPEQRDDAAHLCLDLFHHLSRLAARPIRPLPSHLAHRSQHSRKEPT